MTVSERLAGSARALYRAPLTEAVGARALERLIDTTACVITGLGTDVHRTLERVLPDLGCQPAQARVVGIGRAPARTAALANGSLAHSLDFDDTTVNAAIHAGGVVVPTALAVGEWRRATVAQVLGAIVVGYAALDVLGERINPVLTKPHHTRGFHTTATLGTFAAALVAGCLMDLAEDGLVDAIGVAASSAAGLLQCVPEGSSVKRVQPGLAASRGIEAALLARAGVTGPRHAFEGRYGFLPAYGVPDDALADLPDWQPRAAFDHVATKLYPACHHSHPVIDCVRRIRQEDVINPADVRDVVVRQPSVAHEITAEPEAERRAPDGILGVQMSIHFAVAITLTHGDFGLDRLESEPYLDERMISLAGRVRSEPAVELDRVFTSRRWPAEVTVTLRDGRTRTARVEQPIGFPTDDALADRLAGKWAAAVARRAQQLPDAVPDHRLVDAAPDRGIGAYLDELLGSCE